MRACEVDEWQRLEFDSDIGMASTLPGHWSWRLFRHQSGASSRYTKSVADGTLYRGSFTCKRPRLFSLTWVASSYFSRKWSPERNEFTEKFRDCFVTSMSFRLPISRIDVNCCQHVIKLHEPDTPWHLHVMRDFFIIIYGQKKKIQFPF